MKIIKTIFILVVMLCVHTNATAQNTSDAHIVGHITDKISGEHLPFVNISLKGTTMGTATDATGHFFMKNIPEGNYTLRITFMGYKTEEVPVEVIHGRTAEVNVAISEDISMMDDVVITASRNEAPRKMSSVVVNVAGPKLFDMTSAPAVGGVLSFQPGLRVENDCQNCGFMQVRINGLQGHYTQIMIDSRPMLSALSGVYGLEQYPADMIERIEVIRGGGSALFGSSAIAGTVNIITKEPTTNHFSAAHNITAMAGGEAMDNVTSLGGTIVSEDRRVGAHIFGSSRNRQAWDGNDDGFTDIPLINSTSFGFTAFYKPTLYSKINAEFHSIAEFRRGGDNLSLPPHETYITEQTDHNINGGSLSYTVWDAAQKNRLNVFGALQNIARKSYYGADKDPDAYGETQDLTAVAGTQYTHDFSHAFFMPSQLTAGVEFNYNGMHDIMAGYGRDMRQDVNIWSAYLQNEWKTERAGILIGARADKHNMIDGVIISPRVNVRYRLWDAINMRASWASGFRAPQAFDEDLHIMAVGGEVHIIQIAEDLREESSQSFTLSADYAHTWGDVQVGLMAEGFYTSLDDVFILSEAGTDAQGNTIMERTNGDGAEVYGVNIEGKIAKGRYIELQAGFTWQNSRYSTPYAWSEDSNAPLVSKMLRSPDTYGYFTLSSEPFHDFKISLTGNYTGSMLVEHHAGYINEDTLEETPSFFDLSAKVSYDIHITPSFCIDVHAGVQNIFNSFQKDLDKGALRDSGYIYGPTVPRSIYAGIKFNIF